LHAAIERSERDDLAIQLVLQVTAGRGGNTEIKNLLKELGR